MKKRPEYYQAFQDAKSRCNNPNNKSYPLYGGRGIKFLFQSYEEFSLELGERPEGYTLDRIDSNGHYEPGNIRWASKQTQNQNRRPHKQHNCHSDNVTGHLGITYDKTRGKFMKRFKGKYIGRYNTLEEALASVHSSDNS